MCRSMEEGSRKGWYRWTSRLKEAVLRPSKRELSQEEIIGRQEAKIRFLEDQLAYIKKVRQERKEAVSKRRKTKQD
ncbi:hypothetical protein D3C76_130600 [compost metagenome]